MDGKVANQRSPVVRIYRQQGGAIKDAKLDMDLSDFAGQIPAVGDKILKTGTIRKPHTLDCHRPSV